MDEGDVRKFLEAVKRGSLPVERAVEQLRQWPYEDLGFAKIDHHRSLRRDFRKLFLRGGKRRSRWRKSCRGCCGPRRRHNILVTRAERKFSRR